MAKPIVDGIERDLQGQARVVRLSVMSEVGGQAALQYGVSGVPFVLIFDDQGQLVARSGGIPNREQIVAQVESLRQ